ncbi:transcriptional regulator [Streptomyces agglomeratus]|uniref:Transcriptional regulator n=1 Tax=Streptomyces agglomeratus TaxID=285458 RepID=A0A1E5PDI3_9ACTN|nr:AAA family ATPase [Streptomyces agglomeratus]OEJ27587.1 transcriptional regulator [Streptomyces agglomeratus]OEJ38354.1 transcriptional regulator [Streptomyces agglomeratus]OEJ47262.1 transcriptional regulator [Streptomyces agglomeratus]OEJ50882.1 transcriptional regulator [Streptomyces agglomeratus]OEJ58245.1 transcriptional regulator [Streptomyces agglomeratus]
MTDYKHGLVLGKFYPPHAGHHHLVRTARERCERLTVLVCASSVESVPLDERVAWMRAAHPDADVVGAVDDIPVDITDPAVWDAHMAVFLAAVPGAVDAVFTSEAYGEELGRRFGADAVCVDPDRTAFPVSGTAVRADPVRHWDFLETPVRAALARRVVVLGAESTGTTTMARALTDHYRARGGVWEHTKCVPEYGREYSERKLAALRAERPEADWTDVVFGTEEFPLIARRQCETEDAAAGTGSPVLFCDTDAFATTVWHERYLGGPSPEVARIAARGGQDLWLLTDHTDVPFEDDGLRDGEHLRPWMTERFREELTRTGRPFVTLRGPHEERLAAAVAAVDALLAGGWGFTDPLPEKR